MKSTGVTSIRRLALTAAAGTLVLLLPGCFSLTSALSSVIAQEAENSAASQETKTSGSKGGKTAASQYQFGSFYGGMWNVGWLGYKDSSYKSGQGTIWKFTSAGSGGGPVTFERALLKVNTNSSQWWRFKLDRDKESILSEFLVGPTEKSGRSGTGILTRAQSKSSCPMR